MLLNNKNVLFKAICIALVVLAFSSASPVLAATLTVTNLNDSGPGSLRDAIATASPGDTIVFGVTGNITLTSGELVINKNLTINGPGAASLAISGNNLARVLHISGVATVSISSVSIENGNAANAAPITAGGAIFNDSGTMLTLTNSTVSGSSAPLGGGIFNNFGTLQVTNTTVSGNSVNGDSVGGGLYNRQGTITITNSTVSGNSGAILGAGIDNDFGTLTVINSTVSGNSAASPSGAGGGIVNTGTLTLNNSTVSGNSAGAAGGIYNLGPASVTNSTFSGNSAPSLSGGGGAILNGSTGILKVTNSTFSRNSGTLGGGICCGFGTVTLKNTLLANSPSGGNCFSGYGGGTFASGGHNLSDDGSCAGFFTQTGDMNNTPAGLDPAGLRDNGGPTQTIALLPISPAVDAIPVSPVNYCTDVAGSPVTTDQRGVTRPQGPACDIGAFELEQVRAAYVANAGSNSVSVINPTTNLVVTTVPVGPNPVDIAVTPNGSTAYVTNAGSNSVSAINTTSNTVVATVTVGFSPVHVAIKADGTRAYVANARSNSISVIDTSTNAVVATVTVGLNPVDIAVTPNGSTAYVTNAGSNSVSAINTTSNAVVATVTVGTNPVDVVIH